MSQKQKLKLLELTKLQAQKINVKKHFTVTLKQSTLKILDGEWLLSNKNNNEFTTS